MPTKAQRILVNVPSFNVNNEELDFKQYEASDIEPSSMLGPVQEED